MTNRNLSETINTLLDFLADDMISLDECLDSIDQLAKTYPVPNPCFYGMIRELSLKIVSFRFEEKKRGA